MSQQFLLPDLGEGLREAEVVQWLVAVGDHVELNQTLAEVETAKATVELPSPYEGTILQLHAEQGETVAVGSPVITVGVAGESLGPDAAAGGPAHADAGAGRAEVAGSGSAGAGSGGAGPAGAGSAGTGSAGESRQPTLVGYGAAQASSSRPARRRRSRGGRPEAVPSVAPAGRPVGAAGGVTATGKPATRPRSTPPVRVYAQRLGVNLEDVSRKLGDTHHITREDIESFAGELATAPAAGAAASSVSSGRAETRISVRGVRKQTAAAMVQSAFTAPQVSMFHTVDVTETMELIAQLRERKSEGNAPIGLLAIVSKAVCLALGEVPELNARWDDATGEIVRHEYVDLGIAVATDRGLLVPHIPDAQALRLPDLARALAELAETARAGKTSVDRLSGGSFTITNIGVFGVEAGTPLLPPGQAGILALGAVRRQPWEHNGEIALREVLTLSLTIDHRVADGEEGARLLRSVGELLSHPSHALLYV